MLQPPRVEDLDLRVPRIEPPAALAGICTAEPRARAGHTYGKSYRDVMRALAGDLPNPPDLVAFPRTEADVVDVLDWAGGAGIAVIPYGGGSSVVGGVEYRGGGHPGVVSLDLSGLTRCSTWIRYPRRRGSRPACSDRRWSGSSPGTG
jgi:alkyldihydroxyacetonephosphate synthase